MARAKAAEKSVVDDVTVDVEAADDPASAGPPPASSKTTTAVGPSTLDYDRYPGTEALVYDGIDWDQ